MSGPDFLLIVPTPLGLVFDPTAPPLGLTIAPARTLDDLARVADAVIDCGDPGQDPGDEHAPSADPLARLDTIVDALNPADHDPGDEDRER